MEVLRSTGQVVNLSLERYLRGPKFEQLQLAIANSEAKPQSQPSPSIASLPRFPIMTVSLLQFVFISFTLPSSVAMAGRFWVSKANCAKRA